MSESFYDVIILGAGQAGLQAAIHAVRRKVSVLVLGQPSKSSIFNAHIENFCCLEAQSGSDMIKVALARAEESGVTFLAKDVMTLSAENDHYVVEAAGGEVLKAYALILAMGISRNKLGVAGEKDYVGRGVSYCVDCDGPMFKGDPVAVIGCGSAAVGAALTMIFYASDVHMVCEQLEVDEYLAEKLRQSEVMVHESRKVSEIEGDDTGVTGLVLDDDTRLGVAGVFVELGARGAVDFAMKMGISLDDTMKYIAVNKKQETSLPGVFAAGDICGPPWQVAKSVGEGCIAGLEAASYVRKRKRTE